MEEKLSGHVRTTLGIYPSLPLMFGLIARCMIVHRAILNIIALVLFRFMYTADDIQAQATVAS